MIHKLFFSGLGVLILFCPLFSNAAGLSKIEQLGKIMYQDKDFSRNKTQSCQTCHHHISGFADPTNMRDPYYTVVSLGDDGSSLGGRNAPSSAYTGFSPPLQQRQDGSYIGGMFWDGRATGNSAELNDPLAEQAQGPPLNPVEMNMESVEAIVDIVRNASYKPLFLKVFGVNSLDDNTLAFDNIARAIAAYERSKEVQKFSSRFDTGQLSEQEIRGLELVETNCTICHSMNTEELDPATGPPPAPLFTNYSYANIGVPVNPLLQDNPTDLGLGGFLNNSQEYGKFKVPTLRNIATTAPYAHNGYFPTLKDIISFKSTRDLLPWEPPEVEENLSMEIGSFNFSEDQIDDIVAFLQSLNDR
jgi:cytochrome c peroxidase